MKAIVWIIGNLYRITFQLVFNIIFNLYWLCHMTFHGYWYFSMRKKALTCENPFSGLRYTFDGVTKTGIFSKWPTWTSLIGVLYYRGRTGNCQDGAIYIKKRLKDFGKKAKIRIYIRGLNVSKVHYVVECEGYVYDLTNVLNFRQREGTAKELAQKASPNVKIYFIQ